MIKPVIVAALLNGNETVGLIDAVDADTTQGIGPHRAHPPPQFVFGAN